MPPLDTWPVRSPRALSRAAHQSAPACLITGAVRSHDPPACNYSISSDPVSLSDTFNASCLHLGGRTRFFSAQPSASIEASNLVSGCVGPPKTVNGGFQQLNPRIGTNSTLILMVSGRLGVISREHRAILGFLRHGSMLELPCSPGAAGRIATGSTRFLAPDSLPFSPVHNSPATPKPRAPQSSRRTPPDREPLLPAATR